MVEDGNLFNMEILKRARKGPLAPTSSERAPSPMPRVGESTSAAAPNLPPASEPEGAASHEEWALVPRKQVLPPPSLFLWA